MDFSFPVNILHGKKADLWPVLMSVSILCVKDRVELVASGYAVWPVCLLVSDWLWRTLECHHVTRELIAIVRLKYCWFSLSTELLCRKLAFRSMSCVFTSTTGTIFLLKSWCPLTRNSWSETPNWFYGVFPFDGQRKR